MTALAIAGTQVVAATRVLEGYWGRTRVGEALAGLGRSRQGKRRAKMAVDTSDMGYLHYYLAFAADPARTLPTRLGNVAGCRVLFGRRRAMGLDAMFWWPRPFLCRVGYLAAVTAGAELGQLVRSCYDLYRENLLASLGWSVPATLSQECQPWTALGQQSYRR